MSDVPGDARQDLADRVKMTFDVVVSQQTYRNIVYLFVLFPLGVGGFTAAITSLAVRFMFLTAPIVAPFSAYDMGIWNIDTMGEGFFLFSLGIPLGLLSLHILNLLAFLCQRISREVLTFAGQRPRPGI